MVKTQIQLEEWQYAAVKRLAANESRSMSEIIRDALSVRLQRAASPRRLVEVAGKYRPKSGGKLKDHDEGWAEAIR